jgi:hypothetical protein
MVCLEVDSPNATGIDLRSSLPILQFVLAVFL